MGICIFMYIRFLTSSFVYRGMRKIYIYLHAASVIAAKVYDLQLAFVRIKTNKLAHLKDDLPAIVFLAGAATFLYSTGKISVSF